MGVPRGAGTTTHAGGRPKNVEQEELVLSLALDWLRATGDKPAAGRSGNRGFGDLVHSVFQWLRQPDGRAAYALAAILG